MKKLFGLALLLGTTATLSACGSIPECRGELDECTYGGPYTEERTVQTGTRMPAPAPAPVIAPAPALVPDMTTLSSSTLKVDLFLIMCFIA